MEIAFLVDHRSDPSLFQQILLYPSANYFPGRVIIDPEEFAEPAGIVIALCFGVAESLEDGVAGEDTFLDGRGLFLRVVGQEEDHFFGSLSLSSPAFPTNDDCLIDCLPDSLPSDIGSHRKDMSVRILSVCQTESGQSLGIVQPGERLVGVEGY
jgi:hypothetical protein